MTAVLSDLADLAEALRLHILRTLLQPEPRPALTVVPAGPPFAASSYARARLLRHLHASGLSKPTDSRRS